MAQGTGTEGFLSREARTGLTLIAPPGLYALLLLAMPIATIVIYSFLTDGYLEIIRDFTFDNYIKAWTDPLYRLIMAKSLGVSIGVTFITVVLAYPVAYYVSFFADPSRKSL